MKIKNPGVPGKHSKHCYAYLAVSACGEWYKVGMSQEAGKRNGLDGYGGLNWVLLTSVGHVDASWVERYALFILQAVASSERLESTYTRYNRGKSPAREAFKVSEQQARDAFETSQYVYVAQYLEAHGCNPPAFSPISKTSLKVGAIYGKGGPNVILRRVTVVEGDDVTFMETDAYGNVLRKAATLTTGKMSKWARCIVHDYLSIATNLKPVSDAARVIAEAPGRWT